MPTEVSTQGERIAAKAAIHGYVILGICFGMPAILAASVVFFRPELFREWAPALGVGLVSVTLVFAWLASFRLQVEDGVLVYGTLFAAENRVSLDDVTIARRVLEFNPWTHWGKPRNRLEIFTKQNPDVPQMYINLKVFRSQDVALLLQVFGPKLRH